MTKYRIKVETLNGESKYIVQLGHKTRFGGKPVIDYDDLLTKHPTEQEARDSIQSLKQTDQDREETVTTYIDIT